MAYSPLEKSYMDSVAEYLLPQANAQPDESDMQLASSNQVMSDAPGIVPIPQTGFEKVMEKTGLTLEQIGSELDKLGKVNIGGIEIGIRDFLPFVGSIEDGKLTGTPAALQAVGRGESLITGTGMTTQLKPDAKLMALDVATAGVAKPAMAAAKATAKGVAKALPKDLPVGMSIKDVGKGVDDLGFYSAASKAVDNIAQDKGTGAQFLAQIEKTPGVKKEELLWTGLDDFLKGKKSVTKAEVQEYLNANRVEVQEVTLGNQPFTRVERQELVSLAEIPRNQRTSEQTARMNELQDMANAEDSGAMTTKFAKYTLPGGENYREVLLTLPAKEGPMPTGSIVKDGKDAEYPWAIMVDGKEVNRVDSLEFAEDTLQDEIRRVAGKSNQKSEFKSGHFEQPNILAHMRLNDRVDADGKKVLFVEEVQSDWHQAGRKYKYETPESKAKNAEIESQLGKLSVEKAMLRDQRDVVQKANISNFAFNEDWLRLDKQISDIEKQQTKLRESIVMGVPDAPFKTSWHELALKRAIQLASEGGYDRIAFTTGKTQAERYDLSKQIDELIVTKNPNGTYTLDATMPDGGRTQSIGEDITEDKLEQFIGKELAQKVQKQDPNTTDVYGANDLRVGGEGMKGFYDTILPKYLDKYGKKWDAKTGMTKIRLASDAEDAADSKLLKDLGMDEGGKATASVHYMDITPKMKESVLTKGQPLFQMAPAIPAGAAGTQMQEENK